MEDRSDQAASGSTRGAAWREGVRRLGRLLRRGEVQPFDFDALAKDLAQGLSRREALRRLGVGLGTAALAATGAASAWAVKPGGGGSGCPTGQVKCKNKCVDTRTDPSNCGACGTVCPSGAACSNGGCCPAGQTYCSGACVTLSTDSSNCGACGAACPAGYRCSQGSCVLSCPAGETACGTACVDLQSDPAHCGACSNACSFGQGCCGGTCLNLLTDVNHCGACGNVCPGGNLNGKPICNAGTCGYACYSPNYVTCGSDACVDRLNDPNHCGDCANVCAPVANALPQCSPTGCIPFCLTDFANCNGVYSDGCEAHLPTDPNNCGACGNRCSVSHGTGVCINGVCSSTVAACDPGFADCNGLPGDGCETSLNTDPNNCGACGFVCPSGTCCSSGACTSVDLTTDPFNCGACGNVCTAPKNATGGFCKGGICGLYCDSGFADCDNDPSNGCETNISADPANCGACGNVCDSSTPYCRGGQCSAT